MPEAPGGQFPHVKPDLDAAFPQRLPKFHDSGFILAIVAEKDIEPRFIPIWFVRVFRSHNKSHPTEHASKVIEQASIGTY